jgi:hypothetical protein
VTVLSQILKSEAVTNVPALGTVILDAKLVSIQAEFDKAVKLSLMRYTLFVATVAP